MSRPVTHLMHDQECQALAYSLSIKCEELPKTDAEVNHQQIPHGFDTQV